MSRCMRTTLTLDPDVAALLEQVRNARDAEPEGQSSTKDCDAG